jgi:hypothetical protein
MVAEEVHCLLLSQSRDELACGKRSTAHKLAEREANGKDEAGRQSPGSAREIPWGMMDNPTNGGARALAFWRSVGAIRYVGEGEALLARAG